MRGRAARSAIVVIAGAALCFVTAGCGLLSTHQQAKAGTPVAVSSASAPPAGTASAPAPTSPSATGSSASTDQPSQQASSQPSQQASKQASSQSGSDDGTATGSHTGAFEGATTVDSGDYRGKITAIGFETPSGNIMCGIGRKTVVCQIQNFDYTPVDCHGAGIGSNVKLKPNGPAALFCAGDEESGGPTLAYGDQLVVGPVRCVSREDGVTCQNTTSGYGFKLSREAYIFFGADDTVGSGDDTISDRFVGSWYGHGRSLKINANGDGTITYRTYTTCSKGSAKPCDTTKGNDIYPGGRIKIHMQPSTSTKITGQVTASNDPEVAVGLPLVATVADHVVHLNLWSGVTFCSGSAVSASKCGA